MKSLLWNRKRWGRPNFASQFNFLCCLCYLNVFCIVVPRVSLDRRLDALLSKRFSNIFFASEDGRARGSASVGMIVILT